MAVAELKPKPVVAERVKELAREWAERCLESGKPPSEELSEVEDLAPLDPEERDFLIRVGAITATNDQLHRWRGEAEGEEEEGNPNRPRTNPMHAAFGRNSVNAYWRALGITLAGADGVLKALLAFTLADLVHLQEDAGAQEAAWSRRKAWGAEAEKALRARKLGALEELPAEVLADLDAKAEEAWRR